MPQTRTQRHRAKVSAQLDALNAKVDALGSILTTLASASKVALPRETLQALQQPVVERASGSRRMDALATSGSHLFETMSRRQLLIRVALVVGAAVLSVSVPNFGFVVALMGSFTTMLVSFILPTVFFVLVHWDTLTRVQGILCALVLCVGVVGMGVGLVNTIFGV